ncbi:MAG: GNAT family N-acetyltransferase [Parachlamydia sp.]|nr:GNAT family N-acetyltransferase [Parachlamydia sp.]
MDDKMAKSFDQNIKEKFIYLPSRIKQMNVRTIENVVLTDSGLQSSMFNIIYCNEKADRSSVQTAIDSFRLKKLPFAFWIGFEEEPSWLEEELQSLGLITDETEWAMVSELDKLDSNFIPELEIRPVHDLAEIQNIINVMNAILPEEEHHSIKSFYDSSAPILLSKDCQLTFFIGYVNKRPVATSSVFFYEKFASIFDIIVSPEMRGKGYGKAMTLQAMLYAHRNGFSKCILTATNDAKYLYQKLGFKDLKTMKVYHD